MVGGRVGRDAICAETRWDSAAPRRLGCRLASQPVFELTASYFDKPKLHLKSAYNGSDASRRPPRIQTHFPPLLPILQSFTPSLTRLPPSVPDFVFLCLLLPRLISLFPYFPQARPAFQIIPELLEQGCRLSCPVLDKVRQTNVRGTIDNISVRKGLVQGFEAPVVGIVFHGFGVRSVRTFHEDVEISLFGAEGATGVELFHGVLFDPDAGRVGERPGGMRFLRTVLHDGERIAVFTCCSGRIVSRGGRGSLSMLRADIDGL